jgi:anti-sigma regulatory factor (Ser/Thr protein kinase)
VTADLPARGAPVNSSSRVLADFELPSEAGNERHASARVADAVAGLGLDERFLDRLKTAVAETVMNAIEHGNKGRSDLPVTVRVTLSDQAVTVRITDEGGITPIPETPEPDLAAKLRGEQSPRGWGLFLIQRMADAVHSTTEGGQHIVELSLFLEGAT